MKLLFIFLIVCSCVTFCKQRDNHNLNTKPEIEIAYDDTVAHKVLLNMVDSMDQFLIKNKLAAISDSIRFYLYCSFYDNTISNNRNTVSSLFCCYDLLPIRCTIEHDSLFITYNSLLFDDSNRRKIRQRTNSINYIRYTYTGSLFTNSNFDILGKVYSIERKVNPNMEAIIAFIRQHKLPVNKWFWAELLKREHLIC